MPVLCLGCTFWRYFNRVNWAGGPAWSTWLSFLSRLIWSPVPPPHMEHVVIERAAGQQAGHRRCVAIWVEGRGCGRAGSGWCNALWDVSSGVVLQWRIEAGGGGFVLDPQVSSPLYEAFLWFGVRRGAGGRYLQGQPGPVGSVRQGVVEDVGGYKWTSSSSAIWRTAGKRHSFRLKIQLLNSVVSSSSSDTLNSHKGHQYSTY